LFENLSIMAAVVLTGNDQHFGATHFISGQENLINYESLYNEGSTLITKFKYIIDKQRERIIQLENQLNERSSTACTLRPYSSESVKNNAFLSPNTYPSNQFEVEIELNSDCSQDSNLLAMPEVSHQKKDNKFVESAFPEHHIECSVPAAVNSLPKVQISTVNDQSCELSSVVHENEDNSVTNYNDRGQMVPAQVKRPAHVYTRNAKKTVDRRFQCGICQEHFSRKSNLKRHITSKHTKEKPFVCRFCGASRSRSEDMKHHMMRVHPHEKFPYKCDNCGSLFKVYGALHNHRRQKICKDFNNPVNIDF